MQLDCIRVMPVRGPCLPAFMLIGMHQLGTQPLHPLCTSMTFKLGGLNVSLQPLHPNWHDAGLAFKHVTTVTASQCSRDQAELRAIEGTFWVKKIHYNSLAFINMYLVSFYRRFKVSAYTFCLVAAMGMIHEKSCCSLSAGHLFPGLPARFTAFPHLFVLLLSSWNSSEHLSELCDTAEHGERVTEFKVEVRAGSNDVFKTAYPSVQTSRSIRLVGLG